MRNIEFRALRYEEYKPNAFKKTWVYGGVYVHDEICTYIVTNEFEFISIFKETLGQFTGLLDVNGVKVFEEDVVKTSSGVTGEMVYDDCLGFIINGVQIYELGSDQSMKLFEVVGNIHEVQNDS
jgi:uncharacterized phage protein (TIGR01671 family)